jgi:para-nitrobenzyl esterase
MKSMTAFTAVAFFIFAAGLAQQSAAQTPLRPNALVTFPAKGGTKLTVTTPGWPDGGDIPFENTQYRTNTFPGLNWSAGPRGTKSYVVIMQDMDYLRDGTPIVHWTLYNIPAGLTKLDPGMAPTGNPPGSGYGPSYNGNAQPYLGPHTPPGPKHRYHLQVFALDTVFANDPTISYEGLTDQLKNHVLASGEVVGLGQVDPTASLHPAP